MKSFLEFEEMDESVKEAFYMGKNRSAAWHADGGANDEGYGKSKSREVHKVYINGRPWKTFGSHGEASKAHAAVSKKYPDKQVSVHRSYVSEEVELDEATFVYHMNKAIAAHDRGDEKKKQMHLDNAKTARYTLKSTDIVKHKDLLDKYSQMREEVELHEGADQHKVIVTVSDPNHPAVSQRKEKIMKRVIVKAKDKDEAHAKASAFYKKKGYKVHETEYHSPQPASSMKTEELMAEESDAYAKSEENKRSADAAKKQGDMFAHHLHMADYHDNLAQWHGEKGRYSTADKHAEKGEEHHELAMKHKPNN